MADYQKTESERIADRFNLPPAFVEAVLKVRNASTMEGKLEAFKQEQYLVENDPEAIEKQHALGRLTARERVNRLLDPGSFEELDQLHRPHETGINIGEAKGQGDGVIVGYGAIDGRPVTLWAQDGTVMGGTMATVHARKVTMIIEKALYARTPIMALFDSEGVRPHDAIQYPDFFSPGSIAYFKTLASGVVPKISMIMGPCTGEMAILAGLGDFIFMVKKTSYIHLMPHYPCPESQKIGDPEIQARITGCVDVLAENEEECLKKCRQLLGYLPSNNMEKPPYVETGDDPNRRTDELMTIVPVDSTRPYNTYKLLSTLVDNGEFFEIKRHWARNLITGFARFGGHSCGIIANNASDRGGCMTLDAADKISKFVRFCDAFGIPSIWIADTPAFLPAIEEETRGLIRHGSRMIQSNSECSVPHILVVIRKNYGGGRLAMPGLTLGGDLSVAWPTHEPGLMGAEGGVSIIYRNELAAIKNIEERERQKGHRVMELQWGLDMMIREETQKIIDPRDTRIFLVRALKWLRNKKKEWPTRKHENFRM